MRRSEPALKICSCIQTFLKNDYRKRSHLDKNYPGVYYWNERDIHWAFYRHLRAKMQQYSIGSEWWVHAEGTIQRPKWVRKDTWKGMKRADIVLINHGEYRRWWKRWSNYETDEKQPPYKAMIEIKLVWRGMGKAYALWSVEDDVKKLEKCLSDGTTENAFLILLDGLNSKDIPYCQRKDFRTLKKDPCLILYHWPDSNQPIKDVANADLRRY